MRPLQLIHVLFDAYMKYKNEGKTLTKNDKHETCLRQNEKATSTFHVSVQMPASRRSQRSQGDVMC